MCGIAGMVGLPDPRLLRAMARILAHRGPDEEALWTDSTVGLASRRLKVIDLEGGRQPFHSEDRRYTLVFNGEIYNYRELRRELEDRGHRFRSRGDGETVVHLYEEEGDACLDRLVGMFAIALWDRQRKRLLLARDPLGIKPLYYREAGDALWFASEAKALLLEPRCPREPDLEALAAYLCLLYVPSPATAFSGIKKLGPGQAVAFEAGRSRSWTYWHAASSRELIRDPEEARHRVREALRQSVERHLLSDVPLGVFLSGGMDSASIVALMRQVATGSLRTFTLDFAEETFGEAAAARETAKAFGTEHHVFEVRPSVAEALPRLAWHLDEPLADASVLNTYLISRLARDRVTVALTGIGGDELFDGYPRYLGLRAHRLYRRWTPRWLRRLLVAAAPRLADSERSDNPSGRLRRFLATGLEEDVGRYLRWITFWSVTELRSLLVDFPHDVDPLSRHRSLLSSRMGEARTSPGVAVAAATVDLLTYVPDDLLMLADKASMASSLELRVPFCDVRVVDTLLSIDPEIRAGTYRAKKLLKRSLEDLLPPSITRRPKRGFSVPIGAWLRGPLHQLASDLLSEDRLKRRGLLRPQTVTSLWNEHCSRRRNHADRLFALLMLELWLDAFWDRWPSVRDEAFRVSDVSPMVEPEVAERS